MQDIPHATIRELADMIPSPGGPRFAFFLGAGASKQSGIPVATDMIRHFKERIISRSGPDGLKTDDEKRAWLEQQDWYGAEGSEYCKCFERFEPMERGRQRHIENLMMETRGDSGSAEERKPSFGYVVLANLMARGYLNTIITTNFDDLVYSACTTFTDIRPTVYAYGVMASEMRIANQRPKILKLHGDYRYSALKNTKPETDTQDLNMARQVKQVLNEYGLIVVGYSGGDESVMEILSDISPDNDLYWCARRGEQLNERVTNFLRDKRGFLIEIEGFDEMMNEVRRVVGFDRDKILGSIEERRARIIEQFQEFDLQYASALVPEANEVPAPAATKSKKNKFSKAKKESALTYALRAYKAEKVKDLPNAVELYRKALELDPTYILAHNNLGTLLNDLERYEEAEAELRRVLELDPDHAAAHNNLGKLLNDLERYEEAKAELRRAIELNPTYAKAYHNLGYLLIETKQYEEAEAALRMAIEFNPTFSKTRFHLARLESLRGNGEAAIENLRDAAGLPGFEKEWVRGTSDFDGILDDPRFGEIVGGGSGGESGGESAGEA